MTYENCEMLPHSDGNGCGARDPRDKLRVKKTEANQKKKFLKQNQFVLVAVMMTTCVASRSLQQCSFTQTTIAHIVLDMAVM